MNVLRYEIFLPSFLCVPALHGKMFDRCGIATYLTYSWWFFSHDEYMHVEFYFYF